MHKSTRREIGLMHHMRLGHAMQAAPILQRTAAYQVMRAKHGLTMRLVWILPRVHWDALCCYVVDAETDEHRVARRWELLDKENYDREKATPIFEFQD